MDHSLKPTDVIWMVIGSFYPLIGGAERQAQGISEHLAELGWDVHVVTRRHNKMYGFYGSEKEEVIRGIKIHRIFSIGPGYIGSILYFLGGLLLIARHRQKCVYYAHDIGAPAWISLIARFLFGGVCIVKIRSEIGRYFLSRWRSWQLKWIARLVDKFILVSEVSKRVLIEKGVPDDKMWFIPNGVDTKIFCPPTETVKQSVRAELNIPAHRFVILGVGRLTLIKGFDVLIEACASFPLDILQRVQVIILGGGSERPRLEGLVREREIEHHFRFEGRQKQVYRYYTATDLFVLPSRSEGLSNALLEAMACGLPVVASRVGGNSDWIEPGKNGFLFTSENSEELCRCLIKLIEDRDRCIEMGKSSRLLVEQELSLSITSRHISECLRSILHAES